MTIHSSCSSQYIHQLRVGRRERQIHLPCLRQPSACRCCHFSRRVANPSRNLACSWITMHYWLVSRGALPFIYLFRLYLPVVPLTRKSELSKILLTLSPYGGVVAMLLSNQSCHSSLACSAALLEGSSDYLPVQTVSSSRSANRSFLSFF